METKSIPWIEKYRPEVFDEIVLDPINRQIFENILERDYVPNMLLYGPPGTGKTTTIINLINRYQEKYNQVHKENVIHLNASDERGIDIIRNQIQQFVKSCNFFNTGIKFVVLDEVDYMTKNAQHALKYLIQTANTNVRFCLICNYISKIDPSLCNEFINIRFNQLPHKDIESFIRLICKEEKISYTEKFINGLINNYQSDIRSMINFLQLHHLYNTNEYKLPNNELWLNIKKHIDEKDNCGLKIYIHRISIEYNMNKQVILLSYFYYLFRNYPDWIEPCQYSIIEHMCHVNKIDINDYIDYICYQDKEE